MYTGDGSASRVILLDFTPSVVLLSTNTGEMYNFPTTYGGLAVAESPLVSYQYKYTALGILENGFEIFSNNKFNANTNQSDVIYHYIAF